MKYTKKDLETIDYEIELLDSKLTELNQKRNLIKASLDDDAITEQLKKDLIKKANDITKEEFVTRIKQLFNQSVTASSNSIEEKIYNKLILLIIEENIVASISRLKEKENEKLTTEQDFELAMTDMVVNRHDLTGDLLLELCNPKHYTVFSSSFATYNDILDSLVNDPSSIGCSGQIRKDNDFVFDYEIAKKLYDELLVPYYISLHFPTRKDENNNDVPFAFCLVNLEFDFDTEKIAKAKKYYMDNGIPSNVIEKMLQTDDGRPVDAVRIAPEEVILMEQYREEMAKGHIKR